MAFLAIFMHMFFIYTIALALLASSSSFLPFWANFLNNLYSNIQSYNIHNSESRPSICPLYRIIHYVHCIESEYTQKSTFVPQSLSIIPNHQITNFHYIEVYNMWKFPYKPNRPLYRGIHYNEVHYIEVWLYQGWYGIKSNWD